MAITVKVGFVLLTGYDYSYLFPCIGSLDPPPRECLDSGSFMFPGSVFQYGVFILKLIL